MVGFTIVLGKRRKRNKIKARRYPRKTNKKIIYLLPLILLLAVSIWRAVTVTKQNKEIEEKVSHIQQIKNFKSADSYSSYYVPVVVNDFTSYKKGDKTDNKVFIKLGVWSIISAGETDMYEAFDGELVIPAKDVKLKVSELFSDDISFTNETVEEEKYSIVFNEETESYFIPIMGITPQYIPTLESVDVKKDKTILCVGCLKSDNYKQDSSGNTVVPEAEKRILITLKKSEEGYHIEEISEK